MPVILDPGEYAAWFDPSLEEPARLSLMLRPHPVVDMEVRAVSDYINNPRNEGKRCLEEYSPPENNRPIDLFNSP